MKSNGHTRSTLHTLNDVVTSLVLMPWLVYKLISDCKFPWSISIVLQVNVNLCLLHWSILQAFFDAITSGICITSPDLALTVNR